MLTAAPMDRQNDFARCLVNISDDIGNEGTQELLTGARGDAGGVPSSIQIIGKADKVGQNNVVIGSLCGSQSGLARLDATKHCFPALLQLYGDEPITWIAGGIASLRERSLILGLLKFQLDDASVFGFALHPLGFECDVNRHRFNRPEKLPCNRGLNPHSTEGQTWTVTTIDSPSQWTPTLTYRHAATMRRPNTSSGCSSLAGSDG